MLQATDLNKSYKSGKALHNFSIQLKSGVIAGLLGRNGAGKTTLFKILCGLVTPDHGTLAIASKRAKPIGAVIEQPGLYSYLTAYENLKIFAQIQKAPADLKSVEGYLESVGLPLNRKDPVRNFSMGMKQRLGIAIALLNDPEILILDEPFSGLDPTGVASLIKLIKELAAQDIAILLSSHLMTELQKCCDYLYVIDGGILVNEGETNTLLDGLISVYTLTATNIQACAVLQPYLLTTEKNTVSITCSSEQIPAILQNVLEEGFAVTSCVPNITLEQLVIPLAK
ncbi:ABC transporter ATP-binding protein [Leeuwenhoekiella marinoflava]|uniref:ABC-2 type transport system ATP-binding protein n=2 Tax=Leeuwenhoekiella marinoflava TaxID=988 RepID=A0A4Q0P3D2_9FLAO|nr:ABC transporter ATP-binding protein [Leeuwenhoekiella marinoflava]RXG21017.1 ABC-2 type transport system ATP-binding protein [Leeuwenhoekiella marinoflava]SHG05535.1 ABC-2 type transport system ATP-binding protein [Leeuwenhoekiella marinoflava DSM 3653]